MVVEMRTYRLKPGKRDEFLENFLRRCVAPQREIGIRLLGPFASLEDPETLFWLRGFPDLRSRDAMKEQFYEGALWKGELEGIMMPMIERYDVTLVDDADNIICWDAAATAEAGSQASHR